MDEERAADLPRGVEYARGDTGLAERCRLHDGCRRGHHAERDAEPAGRHRRDQHRVRHMRRQQTDGAQPGHPGGQADGQGAAGYADNLGWGATTDAHHPTTPTRIGRRGP
jgi:hypothetical protein